LKTSPFGSSRLRGFGGFASADGSRFALRHHLEQGLEENGSKDAVENKEYQDCRHSLKEQFPKLVNNLLHLSCFA